MIFTNPRTLWANPVWVVLAMLSGLSLADLFGQNNRSRFTHLSVAEGLPSPVVRDVVQDRQGFMWIATEGGLAKFDGHTVKTFHPWDLSEIRQSFVVQSLCYGSNDLLWLGTLSGLFSFNLSTEQFRQFKPNKKVDRIRAIRDYQIHALAAGAGGKLWVGHRGGLACFDPTTEHFESVYRGQSVTAVNGDKRTSVWFGTRDGKLCRIDSNTDTTATYRIPLGEGFERANQVVSSIVRADEYSLWVGVSGPVHGGLFKFDQCSEIFEEVYRHDRKDSTSLSSNSVSAILLDEDAQLWVGTSDGGLDRAETEFMDFYNKRPDPVDNRTLPDVRVSCLFVDRSGLLWVGTRGRGVSRVDPGRRWSTHFRNDTTNLGGLLLGPVVDIAEHANHDIWVALSRGVVHRKVNTGEMKVYTHEPRNAASLTAGPLRSIHVDRGGDVWVGANSRLDRLNPATGKVIHYGGNQLRDRSSWGYQAICEDQRGDLWYGSKRGLLRYDRKKDQVLPYPLEPPNEAGRGQGPTAITSIIEDREGILWMGKRRRGLLRLDPRTGETKRFQHEPNDPASLSDRTVKALCEDSRGWLWVGTQEGLNRMNENGRGFIRYTKREGLRDDDIRGIVEDHRTGDLWLGTSSGVVRMSGLETSQPEFRFFEELNGVFLGEISGCLEAYGHDLLFGTNEGVFAIYPNRVQDSKPPLVVLTELKLMNEPVSLSNDGSTRLNRSFSMTETVTLSPDDEIVTFCYAAMDFAAPSRHRFSYKLEGFDETWTLPRNKNSATYTNLPPGNYDFRVRAANHMGQWSEGSANVQLVVLPPWYRTPFFLVAAPLSLLGLAAGAHGWRTRRIRLRNQVLKREVADRKRAQLALASSEEQLRLVANGVPAFIAYIDANQCCQFSNTAHEELLGLSADAILGMTVKDVLGELAYAKVKEHVESAIEGKITRFTEVLPFPDGSTRHVTASLIPNQHPDGRIDGFIAQVRDVTEQKHAEQLERKRRDELAHYARVATVGEMTGAMAHEINQPLASVNLNGQTARRLLDREDVDKGELLEIIDDILHDNSRASEIVKRLRYLLKKEASHHETVAINKLIKETLSLVHSEFLIRGVQATHALEEGLPNIEGDPIQLQQVLINLLLNAAEALTELEEISNRVVTIRTSSDREAKSIQIVVEDCGPGIAPETLSNLFTPFVSTKDEGLGLGLPISRSIVEIHRGQIWAESTPDTGTRFTICLPILPIPTPHD